MSSLKEINGKYYQQCKVVMLATKSGSQITIRISDNRLLYNKDYFNTNLGNNQHLYILSDEEIEEGDWFFIINDNRVCKCTSISKGTGNIWFEDSKLEILPKFCKKIIAATDTSLKIESELDAYYRNGIGGAKSLPQPSQSFIKKYIEEYNSGNKIEDVLVENEYYNTKPNSPAIYGKFAHRLKVDSDNTITIKKLKDSYTKEEVESIIIDALLFGSNNDGYMTEDVINKWIKENL